jgi:hypothetical protein
MGVDIRHTASLEPGTLWVAPRKLTRHLPQAVALPVFVVGVSS